MQAIRDGNWMQGTGSSGALANPGKSFYLKLAAECVHLANAETTKDGMNYARKAMILCGLSLLDDGKWKVEMLSKELQDIVRRFPIKFRGELTPSETVPATET